MTWIEAIPPSAVIIALFYGANCCTALQSRSTYRGILDRRISAVEHQARPDMVTRLEERDRRLVIYPTNVQWIHPLWCPKSFPLEKQ